MPLAVTRRSWRGEDASDPLPALSEVMEAGSHNEERGAGTVMASSDRASGLVLGVHWRRRVVRGDGLRDALVARELAALQANPAA